MLRRTVLRGRVEAAKRAPLMFQDMHGFRLVRTRRVDELNLVAYEMQHAATAAAYYHIDIDDTNNTFCIGFRTPAENDKGTSHVLEHTVLCGSRKYPVRDPFFMMLRRSLSTFMNAMTGADYTLYPFATTNSQDYTNLLDVYLDAVFHPLLRPEDFRQEGHRVELKASSDDAESDKQSRLVHNGVVYNEMRGVVSEPNQHFVLSVMSTMLPETHYTHVSGGYPPNILDLTYEELVAFHKRHYHPSNSMTFTYGDQHPEKHMAALDASFRQFERSEAVVVPTLPEHCRFAEPRVVNLSGPLDSMGNHQQQKRVAVAYGVPQARNELEDVVALSVLDTLLSNGPSSPMYKALIESHIGSKYSPMRGYAYYLSSPIVSYGVAGVSETRSGAEEEVLEAVTSTLRTVQTEGFDRRRVESVIFQEELQQRHRAADYGLDLCVGLCAMGLCRVGNSPLDFINWLPHLKKIGEDGASTLLPRIGADLLDNPHRAVISVSAEKGYLDRLRDELRRREDQLNATATAAEKERLQEENREWLERVRAPQNADLLPTLTVNDIPLKAFAEPVPMPSSLSVNGAVSTIAFPTNGLVYVHGLIPYAPSLAAIMMEGALSAVSQDTPLVTSLLTHTGAGRHSFKELSVEVELVCGGFSFSPVLNESYQSKTTTICGTTFGFYTTVEKLKEALDLLRTALLEPRTDLEDPEVFDRVLSQMKMRCSGIIQSLQTAGNRVAVSNAVSKLTRRAALREHWWGLAQCKHAASLLEKLQGNQSDQREAVAAALQQYRHLTESLVAGMSSGQIWGTCEAAHRKEVEHHLQDLLSSFPAAPSGGLATHLPFPSLDGVAKQTVQLNEQLSIDTNFVGCAIPNDLTWQHEDQAPLRVACQLLSNEYLHRRVREEGGAYGSGSAATLQGQVGGVTLSSYRDPTPQLTVKAFEEAGCWLADGSNITTTRVDEAKLRLFSSLDAPYAADSFGESYFYHDVRQEVKQAMRDALLRTTPSDVVRVAKYFMPEHRGMIISVLEPSPEDAEHVDEPASPQG